MQSGLCCCIDLVRRRWVAHLTSSFTRSYRTCVLSLLELTTH
nr:MAG TPA: hypothetical protein [Caudoviricetes sp.]DAG71638.1 MAG TPA: hypothetical protein [Caudoviricetes sp.]